MRIQSDLDFFNQFGRAKKLTESNINKIEKIIHRKPHTIRGITNSKFVNNFENSQYRGQQNRGLSVITSLTKKLNLISKTLIYKRYKNISIKMLTLIGWVGLLERLGSKINEKRKLIEKKIY